MKNILWVIFVFIFINSNSQNLSAELKVPVSGSIDVEFNASPEPPIVNTLDIKNGIEVETSFMFTTTKKTRIHT